MVRALHVQRVPRSSRRLFQCVLPCHCEHVAHPKPTLLPLTKLGKEMGKGHGRCQDIKPTMISWDDYPALRVPVLPMSCQKLLLPALAESHAYTNIRTPANVHFEVDDCEAEWTYHSTFDYIHCRYMATAIKDWLRLLRQCFE